MTKCVSCDKELGDNYKETKIFCNQIHLDNYTKYMIDSYIDSNIYEIIRDNRDVAIEVLKP